MDMLWYSKTITMWQALPIIAYFVVHGRYVAGCFNDFSSISNSPVSPRNLTFPLNGRAILHFSYVCNEANWRPHSIYWLMDGQNYTSGQKLYYTTQIKPSWLNPLEISSVKHNITGLNSSATLSNYSISVNITIQRISLSFRNSKIGVTESGVTSLHESPKIEICCLSSSLPSGFRVQLNEICVTSTVEVVCNSGNIFDGVTYVPSVPLSCIDGGWSNLNATCYESCSPPTIPQLAVTRIQAKYRVGYKVKVRCHRGKMHASKNAVTFISETEIACSQGNQWNDPGVSCWDGQSIEFAQQRANLLAGLATIFVCKARSPLKPRITLGDDLVNGQISTWENITMTPNHNGIIAKCKEMDEFGRAVHVHETLLDVKYKPELTSIVASRYGFGVATASYVPIPFRANPLLTLKDIDVKKGGASTTNYYLTNNGTNHLIIVHFTSISTSDFGEYIVKIKSQMPEPAVLSINFTLFDGMETATRFGSAADIATICLGVAVLILVIIIVTLWIKAKGKSVNKTDNISRKVYDNTEMEDTPKSASKTRYDTSGTVQGKENKSTLNTLGYENIESNRGDARSRANPYVVAAKKPPPKMPHYQNPTTDFRPPQHGHHPRTVTQPPAQQEQEQECYEEPMRRDTMPQSYHARFTRQQSEDSFDDFDDDNVYE